MRHLTDAELLENLGPKQLHQNHVVACTICQKRLEELAMATRPLGLAPAIDPWVSAQDILLRAQRPSRSSLVAFSLALMLSILGLFLVSPRTPVPSIPTLTLQAENAAFGGSRIRVAWTPGSKIGILTVTSVPSVPNRVLEMWMIHGQTHVPVALIPSVTHTTTLTFAVPNPHMSYQAIGVTLEPAPNMPSPTGPRIFFGRWAAKSS
jgi:hypothetical protein